MAESLVRLGYKFSRMKRRVAVAFPPHDVAQQLEITVQDPTLLYTFVMFDLEDRPVEWVRIYVHPNEQQHWETFDVKSPAGRTNAKV